MGPDQKVSYKLLQRHFIRIHSTLHLIFSSGIEISFLTFGI